MQRIAESELIINQRGAVYHLNVHPDELGPVVITVGDPDRVQEISKHFDAIEVRCKHREFITHTGRVGQKRISVVSTGIGPDNIDIVLNELDALANIDFGSRKIKPELQCLQIIRLGTSGALQDYIPVDSFVASTHAIGLDNLMHYYHIENNDSEKAILQHFITHSHLDGARSMPYITSAATNMLKHFAAGYHHGITLTCPGFYGPQGRILRLGLKHPGLIDRLSEFRFGNHIISNFEMETSAIYGLGTLTGHHCLSLSAIVANRVSKEYSKDGQAAVSQLIEKSLTIIHDI